MAMRRGTLCLCSLLVPAVAAAQDPAPPPPPPAPGSPPPASVSLPVADSEALTLGGRAVLGGFGRFGFADDDGAVVATKASVGLGIVVDKPLVPAFAIGGALELHSWGLRDDGFGTDGRNLLVDIMARPRLRHVYDDTLEFAFVIPVGVMLSAISENGFGERDAALGWSIGGRPQVRLHVDSLVFDLEAGWHRRAARHEVSNFQFDAFTNEVVVSVGVGAVL